MDINKHIKYILCDIPIYWINLEGCIERREKLENIFKKYSLNNKRIDAIDGNLLDINELKKKYNINKKMKNNTVACALSHIKAIEQAYYDKLDKVIIMEDDCNFDYLEKKNINLEDLSKNKDDWEVIQLGITAKTKICEEISKLNEILTKRFCWGAFSYLINRNGMKKVINHFNKSKNIEVSENIVFKFSNTYITKPYFTYYTIFESLINIKKDKMELEKNSKLFWDNYYENKNTNTNTNNTIIYDSNNNIKLGNELGHGHTRTVYEHPTLKDIVIKTHRKNNKTANKVEYDIYCKLKNDIDIGKYLCPIIHITDDYQYLYMKKAILLIKKNFTEEEYKKYEIKSKKIEEDFLKKYNNFFLRNVNYGILDDNVVIIDYAGKYFRSIVN